MGTVTSLHRNALDFVHDEAQGQDLQACALIGIDSDGNYLLTAAGLSPEEMVMCAELLRERALQSASE